MGKVTVELTGDEQRLLNSLQKVIDKERDLAAAALRAGEQSEEGSRKAMRGAESLTDKLQGAGRTALEWGVGFASVSQGIERGLDKIIELLDTVQAKQRESFQKAKPGWEAGQLAQLAGGDPAKLQEMFANAQALFASGAVGSEAEGRALEFALQSAGVTSAGDRNQLARAAAFGLVDDPSSTVRSLGMARAAFGQGAGDILGILSAAQAAAGPSTGNLEQVLATVGKTGAGAAGLGWQLPDVLALTGVLSAATSPEEAATQIASLEKVIGKNRSLNAGDIQGTLQRFQGMSPEQLQATVGDQEAIRAIQVGLQSLELLRTTTQATRAAMGGGGFSQALSLLEADPAARATVEARRAAAREELTTRQMALGQAGAETSLANIEAAQRAAGQSEFGTQLISGITSRVSGMARAAGVEVDPRVVARGTRAALRGGLSTAVSAAVGDPVDAAISGAEAPARDPQATEYLRIIAEQARAQNLVSPLKEDR